MDRTNKSTISCIDVPVELLDKTNAKIHFRKFGRIIRLLLRPKSRTCSIEYDNITSAQRALVEAGEYNGQKFTVNWDTQKISSKKPIRKKNNDPTWTLDPEVQAELNAMDNYSSQYNLRGEKMDIEVNEKSSKKVFKKTWKTDKIKSSKKPENVLIKRSIKAVKKEEQELLNVMKQPGITIEDKYKILEARDKLVRLHTKKNTDMRKVEATVGTCPDMCPEKERIMREIQHQVHMYEQELNDRAMNHTLAVKQYSRSSADQEVPLPYELRPVSVLQLTMGYLMHNIMDLCENQDVNMAEWYHFLWDRTRSIRKDITQQELCCEGSVELLEQCARFHIHCSARLASEDPSVFDQKINTENLTKCLQTLKYMYHDLKLKGVYCKNEPEFRAYIILLNLNDGNFMWEVQQLENEVTKSKQVKFALDIYSALDKNNYIKFFKLVQSTTYLNSCILLRYFVQIRLKALNTLLKSYTPRSPFTNFPVDEFARILAFEDVESGIDFLQYYNLYLTPERTHVVLNRKVYCMPEMPYAIDRAVRIIESKRNCSVGEVVCGKALPSPLHKNYIPHSSFDANGMLKPNEYLIDLNRDEIEDEDVPDCSGPLNVEVFKENKIAVNKQEKPENFGTKIQQNIPKPFWLNKPTIFDFDSVAAKTEPLEEKSVAEPDTEKKLHGGFKFDLEVHQKQIPQETVTNTFIPPQTAESIHFPPKPNLTVWNKPFDEKKEIYDLEQANEKAMAEIEANKRKEEELRLIAEKKLEEERKKKQEEELRKKLEAKIREKQLLELERQKALENERKEKQKRKLAEEKRLLEIKTTVTIVLNQLITKIEDDIKFEKLNKISKNIRNYKLKIIFKKWQHKTKLNKRKRKAVDQCPTWIYHKSTTEEAEELYTTTQEDTLKNMKRYKTGKSEEIQVNEESIPEKIDLKEITFQILLYNISQQNTSSHVRTRLYWKVNISIPDNYEVPHSLNRITNAIDHLFDWKTKNNTKLAIEEYRNPFNRIIYCVESQQGIVNQQDTNGLIFIAKVPNEILIKRLKESLKNYNELSAIPLFLIIENVQNIEQLQFIKSSDYVSNYKIVTTQFTNDNLKNSIEQGFEFLANNLNEPPPLELDMLKSFLFKYLATEPWKRIVSFAKWNRAYKSCLMKPRIVVKLYNEALDHIKLILLDTNMKYYSNFPDIFNELLDSKIPDSLPCDYKYFPNFSKSFSYRTLIEKLLNTLKLPNYTAKWPKDAKELEQIVYDYCKLIFKEPQKQFYKVMAVILRNINYEENFYEKVREILWTDIIETIAIEKINETDFSLKQTPFNKDCIFNECFVTYNIHHLNEYKTKAWFYVENPIIKNEIDTNLFNIEKEQPQFKRMKYNFYDIDLDATMKEIDEESVNTKNELSKNKEDIKHIEDLLKDLEESMAISQKISLKFNNTLSDILHD